jgi:hypothetical protein
VANWRQPDGMIAQCESDLLRPGPTHGFSTMDTRPIASRSVWLSMVLGGRSGVPGSGGDGRFAVLALTALARGAGRRWCRAVRVADRQLIGLPGRDLRLVEVLNIHPDRLGTHYDSFLCRSAIETHTASFLSITTPARRNITIAQSLSCCFATDGATQGLSLRCCRYRIRQHTSSTAPGRAWRRHGGLAAWVVVEGDDVSVSRCACSMSRPSRSTACW